MFVGVKRLLGFSRDATTVWRSSLFAVRLVALVMASVAFSGVLYMTEPAGPGLQASSASYLGAADALVQGRGLRAPTARWFSPDSESTLTRYPPGYSVALALPVAMGLPPVQAARLVEALAAFVAMAVLLAIVGDAAGAGAAVLMGLALLVTPALVDVHLSVLSEPLFLACLALTLATMVAMPDLPIAAGVCAAAALMVRFTGIGAVMAVVVWTLLRRAAWHTRLVRATLGVAPALALAVGAMTVTRGLASAVARRLGVHGGLGNALAGAGRTVTLWLAPTAHPVDWMWWIALPAAVGVIAMLVVGTRRVHRLWRLLPEGLSLQSSTTVPQLLAARVLGAVAVLGGSYAAVLLAARLFVDGSVMYDYRLLSPLIMLTSVAFAVAAATWWRSATRGPRVALAVVLLVWGVAAGRVSWRHVHDGLEFGTDLGHEVWRRSAMLDWARADGARYSLYSNWPSLAYFYLDRPARGLPESSDAATLRAFADTLAARGGVILAFTAANPRYAPSDSLLHVLGLRVLAAYPDGRVLAPALR